ncbi:putative ABM domain-containing protein [Seiridium unicorne]|uniref:ABM domain-containing protein n=1 Tax=Seiridium unicorne TaxID=138068 RepID=A0ABR2UEK7_9PEZI
MGFSDQIFRVYPSNLRPITPASDWFKDDKFHPGFVVNGTDDKPDKKAYYIHLEAKPGKEDLVASFLRDINNGVFQEQGTDPWFGLRYSQTTFAIFEAFSGSQHRTDHDNGLGGCNFLRVDLLKDMLAYPAQIYRLDVLHGKGVFGEDLLPLPEPVAPGEGQSQL